MARGIRQPTMSRLGRWKVAAVLSVAAAAGLSACGAASAGAAALSIRALSGGRVEVRLVGAGARGVNEFVLDGRRVARTARRVVSVSVWQRGGRVFWRRLVVRRAGSGAVVARGRFAVGVSRSRAAPMLVLLAGPPARLRGSRAVLRFSASQRRVWCGRDGRRLRRCGSPVVFAGLSPGAHAFVVRASNRHGSATIRVKSTVAAGPVPQPSPRQLLFEDDFNGTTVDTAHWRLYDSSGNAGHGLRRPSAISLDGAGHLVITARTVDGQLVSGGMANRLDLRYGWFEFRVRTDPDPTGTLSGVVLTWPESGRWPQDGENDIYETGPKAGVRDPFHSYVHYGADNRQYQFSHLADGSQWHTVAMDWRADAIRFYLDGAPAGVVTDKAAIPDVPHHLDIQLDAWANRTLPAPVRMYVDYVRIYR